MARLLIDARYIAFRHFAMKIFDIFMLAAYFYYILRHTLLPPAG